MAATLTAQPREGRGKNAARALRRSGRIPAVVYGHGEDTRALSIDSFELERLLSSISAENTVIDLQVEGGAGSPALIREVQYHPYKQVVLHIDLYQVHAGERLSLEIPVRLLGNPIGVREQGGVLDQVLYDLEIECLPQDIPESAEIDVSGLEIGDSIRVHDLSIPNVEIQNDGDLPICSITSPTVAALPAEPTAGEGLAAELEPELIREGDEDAEDVPASEQG